MKQEFLDTKELAERWGFSPRTLEKWRQDGRGPRFVKAGPKNNKVLYAITAVKNYEKKFLHRTGDD